ncbi:hypothetical protein, partial [Catenovulum maritimum]
AEEQVIKMEILTGIESPSDCLDKRMTLQVQMLSNKLNEGEELTLDSLLKQWLNATQLDNSTLAKAQFDRVKAATLASLSAESK